jgi:hypothetical protein
MRKVIVLLLMLIAAGFFNYAITKIFFGGWAPNAAPSLPDGYGIWLLLLLPFLYLMVVGIHELGHVAVGHLQNFGFYGLTVGPFGWKPDDEGKIRFHWNKSLNLTGGIAIMLPNGTENLRKRFMWLVAGGPLASLLLSAFALGLSLLVPPSNFLYFSSLALCLLSTFAFVVSTLPSLVSGSPTDGMHILTFVQNGPVAAAELAGLLAIAHLRTGQPHAELPAERFAAVAANEETPAPQRVTIDYYRYLHALAVGDTDRAAKLYAGVMDRLDVYPKDSQGSFYLEQALFEAHYRQDLPAAEAALARYTDSPFTEAIDFHLADAAIAALRKDWKTLAPLLPAIERALPSSMDQSRAPIIKDWLNQWKDLVTTP